MRDDTSQPVEDNHLTHFTPLHHNIAEQLGYKQTPGYASWDKVEETAPVQVIDRLVDFLTPIPLSQT